MPSWFETPAVFLPFSVNPPMIRWSFHMAAIGAAQISLANGKTTSGLYCLKDSANRRPPSTNTFSMVNMSATMPSDELIDANAPKGFFEATQKEKQRYASELTSRQTASDEIIRLVSAKMLDWLQTGQTPIETEILPPERAIEPQTPATQPAPSRIESSPPSRQPCEFRIPEAPEPVTDDSASTEDDIRSQIRRIGSELIAVADNDEITDEQQIPILRDQIARLAAILQHLASRSTNEIEMKEDKVDG